MAEVIKFYPSNAADNPDAVLEQAIGELSSVLILGWAKDGSIDIRCSSNQTRRADILWLMEVARHSLITQPLLEES